MTEAEQNKVYVKELVENLDRFDWATREKDCIRELAKVKRFNKYQVATIKTLMWRLSEMRAGGHKRVKAPWEG